MILRKMIIVIEAIPLKSVSHPDIQGQDAGAMQPVTLVDSGQTFDHVDQSAL